MSPFIFLNFHYDVISQILSLENIVFLLMYIFIYGYLFIKMILMSCFVFLTLNLGRKNVDTYDFAKDD